MRITAKQKLLFWTVVEHLETIIILLFNSISPFIPAIVIAYIYGYNILSFILFFGGLLKMCYYIFNEKKIKHIWFRIKMLYNLAIK